MSSFGTGWPDVLRAPKNANLTLKTTLRDFLLNTEYIVDPVRRQSGCRRITADHTADTFSNFALAYLVNEDFMDQLVSGKARSSFFSGTTAPAEKLIRVWAEPGCGQGGLLNAGRALGMLDELSVSVYRLDLTSGADENLRLGLDPRLQCHCNCPGCPFAAAGLTICCSKYRRHVDLVLRSSLMELGGYSAETGAVS
jgi:hypothetical protein